MFVTDVERSKNEKSPHDHHPVQSRGGTVSRSDVPKAPESMDAEQAVLGAILRDPSCLAKVQKIIPEPSLFYYEKHRLIYRSALTLQMLSQPVDIVTVSEHLMGMRGNAFERVGGRSSIVDLAESAVSIANVQRHAEIVREKHHLRAIIENCAEATRSAYEGADESREIASSLTRNLLPNVAGEDEHEFRLIGEYAVDLIEHLESIAKHHKPSGVPTGYDEIDLMTSGFHRGDLIVVGGRPSNGKTAIMNCMASHQVVENLRVGVFSAETKADEYTLRSLCTHIRMDSMQLKRGNISDDDWKHVTRGMNDLGPWNYWINDTTAIDIPTLTMKATELVEREKIDVLYVDYLQKMARPKQMQEREGLAYITQSLKNLAKSLNIPIVAMSQLSRDMEKRQNKRPQLSDFKGTGEIEQEADLVVALYRPELYIGKKKKGEGQWKNICQVIILKQRNGPIGEVDLHFNPRFTLFETIQNEQPAMPF